MERLAFCDYHNMVTILEKSEHNVDFHPIVDFVEAYPLRIETTEEGTKILANIDGNLRTISESSIRRNIKLNDEVGISSLPNAELFENLTLTGYNISPNQKFTFQKGQFSHQWKYLIHTIMQCLSPKSTGFNEFSSNIATALLCLATNRVYNFSKMIFDGMVKNVNNKVSKFLMYLRRARITQSSALPPVADEHASPLRDVSQVEVCPTVSSLDAEQDRARVKLLEDREGGVAERSRDDVPIKGRRLDEWEEAAEKGSNDTEEMINVLTSMDAATVLSSRVAKVPTISGSIPTAGPPAAKVPTSSDVVPPAGLIFTTATVVTAYTRRKGKENMIESETPKKNKIQEQMDIQMARQLKEETERFKRKGLKLEQVSEKKLKTSEEVLEEVKETEEVPEDKVKEMMQLVHVEEHLDREDLNQLWRLVKESLIIRPPTGDKEMELWVELKRLYEPDDEDQLWTHTQNLMHAPVEWRLYDTCEVHHMTSKDKEIFMLVEKDYPLRKGLAIVMICYKLQMENYSQMANDLIVKIYKIANCPSQKDD
nr:synaptobrevin, longin-like domain protein [Tanacetum cinerariifolium]